MIHNALSIIDSCTKVSEIQWWLNHSPTPELVSWCWAYDCIQKCEHISSVYSVAEFPKHSHLQYMRITEHWRRSILYWDGGVDDDFVHATNAGLLSKGASNSDHSHCLLHSEVPHLFYHITVVVIARVGKPLMAKSVTNLRWGTSPVINVNYWNDSMSSLHGESPHICRQIWIRELGSLHSKVL